MSWPKFIPVLNLFLMLYYYIKSIIERTISQKIMKVFKAGMSCALIGIPLLLVVGLLKADDSVIKLLALLLAYVVVVAIDWAFEKP